MYKANPDSVQNSKQIHEAVRVEQLIVAQVVQ